MIRKTLLALAATAAIAGPALAAGEAEVTDISFSFEGPFGSFDPHQLQRGLQVFQTVCAACHGIKRVAFRNLGDPGGVEWPEEQIKAFIAEFYPETTDKETGEPRATRPSDYFPPNVDAGAPDLSLMAKARAGFHGPMGLGINQLFKGIGGPEYIYSLLTGYHEPPACAAESNIEGSYNIAFPNGGYPAECIDENGHRMAPGSWIAMPQPLMGQDVEYQDGTPATLEQEAEDVAAFLMWVAEPKMMARKEAGLTAVLFLIVLSVLLYFTNKKLWAPVKRQDF
ncbi:MAG: cytochrome c [Paracoccaceae bacterium]|nr:MAG: cytochrome c [Paracoccaceae bacterium]